MNRLALLSGSKGVSSQENYQAPKGTPVSLTPLGELFLPLEGLIDVEAERDRLTKEIDKVEKEIAKSKGKLGNTGFVDRAPAEVVEQERQRLNDWTTKLDQLKGMLSALS